MGWRWRWSNLVVTTEDGAGDKDGNMNTIFVRIRCVFKLWYATGTHSIRLYFRIYPKSPCCLSPYHTPSPARYFFHHAWSHVSQYGCFSTWGSLFTIGPPKIAGNLGDHFRFPNFWMSPHLSFLAPDLLLVYWRVMIEDDRKYNGYCQWLRIFAILGTPKWYIQWLWSIST